MRHELDGTARRELEQVDLLAERLRRHLELRVPAIDIVHIHGASSSAVQTIVAELLESELGFRRRSF